MRDAVEAFILKCEKKEKGKTVQIARTGLAAKEQKKTKESLEGGRTTGVVGKKKQGEAKARSIFIHLDPIIRRARMEWD
jgi:hypothetical protein